MNQLYEVLEVAQDILAKKFLNSYTIANTYKAVVYSFIYAAIQKKDINYTYLLKPLEQRIPRSLIAAAKRDLIEIISSIIEHVDRLLQSPKPVVIEGEADLRHVVEAIRYEIGNADHVLVYDCMSLIEQLVASAFLRVNRIRSGFLSEVFVNPVGLTKFPTKQLANTGYQTTLSGLAKYVADKLNADLHEKSSYIDERVHSVGMLGVEEFVDRISIDRIAYEILGKASNGRTLVFSDHGYDLVVSPEESYIYVTHGFKQDSKLIGIPLLLLSRITLFMGAYRAGES